jgi:hypothetical protein
MKEFEGKIFGLDFDGTVVTHEFPQIGTELPHCVAVLNRIVNNGGRIVLNTMRSDREEGDYLTQAVDWFKERNIPLFGINVNPEQTEWTTSPKVYAHIYIDDAALGCPTEYLAYPGRPSVNWHKVEEMLFGGKPARSVIRA